MPKPSAAPPINEITKYGSTRVPTSGCGFPFRGKDRQNKNANRPKIPAPIKAFILKLHARRDQNTTALACYKHRLTFFDQRSTFANVDLCWRTQLYQKHAIGL